MRYKGQLRGFPSEVVDKMLDRQVEQGNERDVSVFEEFNCIGGNSGGFSWRHTKEGYAFWDGVIEEENFDLFFQKYPKYNVGDTVYHEQYGKGEVRDTDGKYTHDGYTYPIMVYFDRVTCWFTREGKFFATDEKPTLLTEKGYYENLGVKVGATIKHNTRGYGVIEDVYWGLKCIGVRFFDSKGLVHLPNDGIGQNWGIVSPFRYFYDTCVKNCYDNIVEDKSILDFYALDSATHKEPNVELLKQDSKKNKVHSYTDLIAKTLQQEHTYEKIKDLKERFNIAIDEYLYSLPDKSRSYWTTDLPREARIINSED